MNVANGFKVSSARWSLALVLAGFTMALSGCASGPKVVQLSGPHPPVPPDQVRIFQNPPSEYGILSIVYSPISDKIHWDAQGDANAGFEQLKADAGRIGANGVLLVAPPNTANVQVIAGYRGMMYRVPMMTNPKTAVVQAIYVVRE
jgi:hypothetical protein